MEKHFNKDDEASKNSSKCWIYGKNYVDGDVKVRDLCHIIGKCRDSTHRDYNIKVKLNYRASIVFQPKKI